MTANKSSKATARAGGGKAARDVSERSVTSGTERVRESAGGGWGWGGFFHSSVTFYQQDSEDLSAVFKVTHGRFTCMSLSSGHSGPPPL